MKVRDFARAAIAALGVVIASGSVAAGSKEAQVRDPRTAPQQSRDINTPAIGKSALTGVVVTDEQTPQPIKRVQVTAANAEFTVTKTVFTNETGRFSIAGLPAGRYTLTASKPPFLRAAYGAKRYDRQGTPITLKDGEQMTDISLRMAKGGVLTGTIVDENGAPAFGVGVRALQLRMQNGERTFAAVASSGSSNETTDDRGTYRFFGLPPGEYAITATPRGLNGEVKAMTESEIRAILQALQQQKAAAQLQTPGAGSGNTPQGPPPQRNDADAVTVGYASVYYPGTTVATSASTVTLGAGEERTGVDFPLKLVRTAKIEGMVVAPTGIPPQSVQLMLAPTGVTGASAMATVESFAFNRVSPGADGKFTFTAVPPGDYSITARATAQPGGGGAGPAPGANVQFQTIRVAAPPGAGGEPFMVMPDMMPPGMASGSPYWGQADISVDGTAISGITVSMQPGMTITGKIAFKGTRLTPDADLSRVRLSLSAVATGAGARISMGAPSAQVDATGQFKITGVTPGRYRIAGAAPLPQGSGPGAGWTLASVIAKGRDVLDFPIDVGPNDEITDVSVTFTDATQELSGTLQDVSGRPAPDYTVIVFAADNKYWAAPTRRTRSAKPGTDGRFTIANLPPGEYRMAAVVDVAPTDLSDPSFLEQLVAASFKITLAEGEKKTQDLRISGGL